MVTETEETQAKDFLKRAEIKTMKKDLRALREVDALKERDKIAKIKTLEEQLEEQKRKTDVSASAKASADEERAGREKVLSENASQERLAEKDLKNYATEQKRQQIFLLESQRLSFEKQIDAIDQEKDPASKLEKNKLLLEKRDLQTKLNSILEQEKKLENEQKVVAEKSQSSAVESQKKALEQRRWELDKEIQEIEKKRWGVEKQVQELDDKIKKIDKFSEQLAAEKNSLRDKILGMDKSLRDIYSGIIARVEERRRGQAQEQIVQREALSKVRAEEKEKTQREQWRGLVIPKKKEFLKTAPSDFKEKLAKSATQEEEQRAKFMQDVENWSQQKTNEVPIPKK